MTLASAARKLPARTWLWTVFALSAGVSCGGDSTGPKTVTSIRFSTQPANVTAGAPFSVTVELANGTARVSGASDPVEITVVGGGMMTGPGTVVASHGLATFEGLVITKSGTNIQLVANSGTITTTSTPFAVLAGPADLAQSVVNPPPCTAPPNAVFLMSFTFNDAFGNPVPYAAVTLASTLAGSALAPSTGFTSDSGTFVSAFASTASGTTAISANVLGHQLAFTPSFVIANPAPPSPMAFPGSVAGTIPTTTCVSSALSAAAYTFTMPAAGGAAFTIASAFTPVFEVQAGAGLRNMRLSAPTTPATVEWLLPAGTFQFAIGTRAGTGNYSIAGASVPANTGCAVRILVAGGTFTGQALGPGDCYPYGNGSFGDIFVMQSALPCTLTLQTSAFNIFFAVYDDVTGHQVGNSSHPPIGADAVIQLPACSSGDNPIDIVASSFSPNQNGAYTMIVSLQGAAPSNLRAISPAISVAPPVDAHSLARLLRMAAVKKGSR